MLYISSYHDFALAVHACRACLALAIMLDGHELYDELTTMSYLADPDNF